MKEKKKNKISNIIKVILAVVGTVAMLALVMQTVDWHGFSEAVKEISVMSIICVVLAFFAARILSAYKFWIYIPETPRKQTVPAVISTELFFILPGGGMLGTASIFVLLRPYANTARIGSAIIIDGLFKFLVMTFCVFVGVVFTSADLPSWAALVASCLFAAAIIFLFFLFNKKIRTLMIQLIAPLRKFRIGETLNDVVESVEDVSSDLLNHPRLFIIQLGLGLLADICTAVPYMILSHVAGLGVPLVNWLWIHGLVRVLTAVPISVGGLGAREGVLVILLGWMGISSARALTISLLYSVLKILCSASCGLFLTQKKGVMKELLKK